MPGLCDTGDHYRAARAQTDTLSAIPLEIETIPLGPDSKSIFENARITGGDSNNVLVVGDQDNTIYFDDGSNSAAYTPVAVPVVGWTGQAILDNNVARRNGSSHTEHYILTLRGDSGGTTVIQYSGGTEGFDELYVFGTSGDDQFYLNKAGGDAGMVIAGGLYDPAVPYDV